MTAYLPRSARATKTLFQPTALDWGMAMSQGRGVHHYGGRGFRSTSSTLEQRWKIAQYAPQRRSMSDGGGFLRDQGSSGSGGGSGSWSGYGKRSWTSYWPLGIAGVTAVATVQAARGIDMDRTYEQLAAQLSKEPLDGHQVRQDYMGGLTSMIHWLHLFGNGPAGQELRRRLAKAGCVDAVLKQEEAWNRKIQHGIKHLANKSSLMSREAKGEIVQAFWMRETCLLAISELLVGSESVNDSMFEGGKETLARILMPPRDSATETTFSIISETGMKGMPKSGADPLSPHIPNSDFGSIAKAMPGTGMGWGDDEASGAVESKPDEDKNTSQGSRKWSVSQVRILQILAKDPRLASMMVENPDAITCVAENLSEPKQPGSGFVRILEQDLKRRILKALSDVVGNLGGNVRVMEDANLQERLLALSRDKDPIVKSLASKVIKDLSDSGANIHGAQEQPWNNYQSGADRPFTAIATEDELRPAGRIVDFGKLIFHIPVVLASGSFYGMVREYTKLRSRTVVALPNILNTASRAGVTAGIGAAATYLSTVFMMQFVHNHTIKKCQTPSEVVSTTGSCFSAQFGLIWVLTTVFPWSFGGFVMANLSLAQFGTMAPSIFGPILVTDHVREKRY